MKDVQKRKQRKKTSLKWQKHRAEMKFTIKHEIKGRMRVHMAQDRMSYEEADTLIYYLHKGSHHFVFEDEACTVPAPYKERFEELPDEYSQLYMAIDKELAAVICIEDPLRDEAAAVIQSLKKSGIGKVVMMTGDSERTAAAIARNAGIDEYYSEVLPEDKARFVEKEKEEGRTVIMIGDGINDSPALSSADVGIAVSDGAEIAREIADITIAADNLYEIITLRLISDNLMKRIRRNYKSIVGINTGLILLGAGGMIQPATSALLHNASTLGISLRSMRNLL